MFVRVYKMNCLFLPEIYTGLLSPFSEGKNNKNFI